jgi:enoyl-CoA hydratase/carnithine racemase
MTEISTFPVPTIAQVDGIATAAGCQLVASCDLAIATETSKFGTPGVNIGLFCSTPAVPLLRTVPAKKHAMELLLTGELLSAQRAYDIGLINRIVHIADAAVSNNENESELRQKQLSILLHQEVQSLASIIASKSSGCIRTGLLTLRQQQGLPLEHAYRIAEARMVDDLLGENSKEGIEAFLTKRKPSWYDSTT